MELLRLGNVRLRSASGTMSYLVRWGSYFALENLASVLSAHEFSPQLS